MYDSLFKVTAYFLIWSYVTMFCAIKNSDLVGKPSVPSSESFRFLLHHTLLKCQKTVEILHSS